MGWEDDLLEAVGRTANKTSRSGPSSPWVGYLLRLHPQLRRALSEVAERRGVSLQTYLRRLIAMEMAKESGEPLAKWLALLPSATKWGTDPEPSFIRDRPPETGRGLEGMCTHPGCDEVHR